MKAIKSVKQPHDQQRSLAVLFAYFHWAVNESIRIGYEKNLTSIQSMNRELYNRLQDGFYSAYAQTAYRMALGMLKTHRKLKRKGKNPKIPYMTHDCIKITNQNYKIENGSVRIAVRAREYIYIKLEKHTLAILEKFKHGSLTITPTHIMFSYSQDVANTIQRGWAGLDINFNNATMHDMNGKTTVFDTSKLVRIARQCRGTISKFTRNDVRIRRLIASKYGKLETDKKRPILHLVANQIASQGLGVFLEDLTGIRDKGRKPGRQAKKKNGKKNKKIVKAKGKAKIIKQNDYKKKYKNTKAFRRELNNWGFYQLQFMIAYKLGWLGLPSIKVDAAYTSSKCSMCGNKTTEEGPNGTM